MSFGYGFHFIFNCLNYFYRNECEKNNIPIPSNMNEFTNLCNKHKDDLKKYLLQNLYESGINPQQNINFELFKVWAKNDNPLLIEYSGKKFCFANSLNF